MKQFILVIMAILLLSAMGTAQQSSLVFFDGNEVPEGINYGSWGFTSNPMGIVANQGYTPGSSAIWWETSDWSWQGIEFSLQTYADLKADWSTASVKYKLIAPAGINTLNLYISDASGNRVNYNLYEYDQLYDGTWKQYEIPLASFYTTDTEFDTTQIASFAIEAAFENQTIPEQMYFDDIWIGEPEIPVSITIFNGQSVSNGISFEAWGFDNNSLIIAEGEGYADGSNAILWETANWSWQGMSFMFNEQNMSYSWPFDSLKLKIKAPAGINNMFVAWKDANGNRAKKILDAGLVVWDGTWKQLTIALSDFAAEDTAFNPERITRFGIEAAAENMTVPERLLITDIWTGSPAFDVTPPDIPQNILVDVSTPYSNFVTWADLENESGETYNVYVSLNPITDINAPGVVQIAHDVPEGTAVYHPLYYPLEDGPLTYFYGVTATDVAGNVCAGVGSSAEAYTNVGKKRAIISLEAPQNFVADSYLDEWQHIQPFTLHPSRNLFTGTITDSLDYSAKCYVAMDNDYLYIAFDVYDDNFTWQAGSTQPWWDNEAIEFFIGLYEQKTPHPYFFRGEEPDYRLVFLPDKIMLWDGDSLMSGTADYLFEPLGGLGGADYIIEARIPFSEIQEPDDTPFTPVEGIAIPFEIFAADADVVDGGNEARIQLGDNAALNPWGDGPEVWTFTWVGMPVLTGLPESNPVVVDYSLENNYPNPFNPATNIEYSLADAENVELSIYNALGQKIAVLVSERQSAGRHVVSFNADGYASGVYFYRLETHNFSQTRKMLLLK
jgi:hypothetical protein